MNKVREALVKGDVELEIVDRSNWQEAFALEVEPDQLRFIAEGTPPVAIALAKAFIRPSGIPATPYAIYSDRTMVGFFNLVHDDTTDWNYWIFHYFIDRRFQGQGLGRSGIVRLIKLLKRDYPACRMLNLTVHPENTRAERLYRSLGFEATGEIAFGEPAYRLALSQAEDGHAGGEKP